MSDSQQLFMQEFRKRTQREIYGFHINVGEGRKSNEVKICRDKVKYVDPKGQIFESSSVEDRNQVLRRFVEDTNELLPVGRKIDEEEYIAAVEKFTLHKDLI